MEHYAAEIDYQNPEERAYERNKREKKDYQNLTQIILSQKKGWK